MSAKQKKPETIEGVIEVGRALARESLPALRTLTTGVHNISYRYSVERFSFSFQRVRTGEIKLVSSGLNDRPLAASLIGSAVLLGISDVLSTSEDGEVSK